MPVIRTRSAWVAPSRSSGRGKHRELALGDAAIVAEFLGIDVEGALQRSMQQVAWRLIERGDAALYA